jgi:outer membrane protein assembly factor BamA
MFDEGRLHLVNGTLRIDTRNDADDPWSGWYVLADLENGRGTILTYAPRSQPVAAPVAGAIQYGRGFLDLRRYNRVSPDAQLNVRIVAGGWLNGDALPMQRRFAVDGPGALPGYDFRSPEASLALACGAWVPGLAGQCDRMALASVEYRGDLHFDLFTDWDDDHYMRSHANGVWVFFADAGRGWLVGTPSTGDTMMYDRGELPPLSTYKTDLGLGLDFDVFGVYVAKAMSAPKTPANLFVRIRHRF